MCQRSCVGMSNRRQWIATIAASGAMAAPTAWAAQATRQPALQPGEMSPQQALDFLRVGNERFVAGKTEAPNRDIDRLRKVAPRQTPFAAFLGCADSRVPIEIVFDQGFGDLFVTRIAGNVAATENIASLEFATQVLGAKVLYVLGHTSCGAVTAAAKGEPVPGQISALFQHIRPAVRAARGDVGAAIRENVKLQAQTLMEASTVIASLVGDKKVIVAGGIFDLQTGRVENVDVG
ncbi:MAG: carbonic anhydrase [Planctomycetia bacterium]|nr:carbonic anhydrase [Planctomycetia bacterium]